MQLFEQTYLAGRVTKIGEEWHVQFSTLGGKTVSYSFDNENDAKLMYAALEGKYLEALNVLQETVIEFGSSIL
jgi:predicted RNA-binding protein Jag